jgi:hypothetical protein
MPDSKLLEKLNSEEIEKLYGWAIQRQLRWAVFTATLVVALLIVYMKLSELMRLTLSSMLNNLEFCPILANTFYDFFGVMVLCGSGQRVL